MIFQNTFCKNLVKKNIRTFSKDTSYKNKLTYFHKNTQTSKKYKNQVENNNVSNTNKETAKNITSFKDKLNNARIDDYDEYYTNRIIKNGGL